MTHHRIKIAGLCGAFPLLGGTFIYGTWRVTRWRWLEALGLMNIVAGVPMVTVGVACLLWHVWVARREVTQRSIVRLDAIVVGVLLLANFPVAAFYTFSAIRVMERYSVSVFNESDSTVESFLVTGPGVRLELGPIAPGKQKRRHLHFKGDGALTFAAHQQNHAFAGELEGYVTGGMDGNTAVRITSSGRYAISHERDSEDY